MNRREFVAGVTATAASVAAPSMQINISPLHILQENAAYFDRIGQLIEAIEYHRRVIDQITGIKRVFIQ